MFKTLKGFLVVLALLISLGMNIATVTVQAVAIGVSSLVGAVAGVSAVLPEFRVVKLRGERKFLTEVVQSTSKRIAKRTAAGATRNIAATFGEAVPTFGVAVIVSATAWELKDACETMKDVHDVEVALDPTAANDDAATEVCGLEVPSAEIIWAKVKASPGEAWEMAKSLVPDLPELPVIDLPDLPEIPDWKFWN